MKKAGSLACLKDMVITSARKWKEEGIVRTIILMWSLRLLYFFRVSPEALSRIYYRKSRNIAIFEKAKVEMANGKVLLIPFSNQPQRAEPF